MFKVKNLLTIICCFVFVGTNAQKFSLKVDAGVTTTFVPDFKNQIIYIDGIVVPGIIDPSNGLNPPVSSLSVSKTVNQYGFAANVELGAKLTDKWSLIFAVGYQQMKFDYDTEVAFPGMQPIFLGCMLSEYGDTNLSYINLRPIDASISFLDQRITIQTGPIFNFLVKGNYVNTLIVYEDAPNTDNIEGIYFESIGMLNDFLFGAHLKMSYTIAGRLDVFLGGNYYFNSIYSESRFPNVVLGKTNSFQLQGGIGFLLLKFGKNEL